MSQVLYPTFLNESTYSYLIFVCYFVLSSSNCLIGCCVCVYTFPDNDDANESSPESLLHSDNDVAGDTDEIHNSGPAQNERTNPSPQNTASRKFTTHILSKQTKKRYEIIESIDTGHFVCGNVIFQIPVEKIHIILVLNTLCL